MEKCLTVKIKYSIGKGTLIIKMHVSLVLCIILTLTLQLNSFKKHNILVNLPISIHQEEKINIFFFMCMHAHWAGNTENKPNALSSVIEKSSYISSKTNILLSYLMLPSPSLIPNYIMIHCDFLLVFFFFF